MRQEFINHLKKCMSFIKAEVQTNLQQQQRRNNPAKNDNFLYFYNFKYQKIC